MKKLSLLIVSLFLSFSFVYAEDNMGTSFDANSTTSVSPRVENVSDQVQPVQWQFVNMQNSTVAPVETKRPAQQGWPSELRYYIKTDISEDEKKALYELIGGLWQFTQKTLNDSTLTTDDKLSKIKEYRASLYEKLLTFVDSTKTEEFKKYFDEQTEKMQKQFSEGSKKKEEFKNQLQQAKDKMKEDMKQKAINLRNDIKDKNQEVRSDMNDLKAKLNITDEQKAKLDELRKTLESEIKTLRESITKDNIEDVKTKAETLKTTYLAKFEEIAPGVVELQKMIEDRFNIFNQNQFISREWVSQIRQESKDNFKQVKQDLVAQYKEKFVKQLANKLDSLNVDKLKIVLGKVNTAIEKQKSSWKPNEKVIAQLVALQSLLQDKIDEKDPSSTINIDELFN